MKTFFKFTIFFLFSYTAFSQNNVGIGTTSPSPNAILHLENGASDLGLLLPNVDISGFTPAGTDEGLMVYNIPDNKIYIWTGGTWVSSTSEWGVNGNDIFSLNSGNVGIGTNLPGEKLTVVDNVFGGIVSLNSSSFNTLMDFNNTSTNPANWTFGYLGNTGVNPGFMTFLRGSHRLVVTNNGDVGIADTNPQARLEINSSGNSSASHALLINNSNPTNIFAVQDDGNVGIGTINPDETLTVGSPLGQGYVTPAISVGNSSQGGGFVIGTTTNFLTLDHGNIFNRARFRSTDAGGVGQGDIEFIVGGIGINTPTPQNDLDVEGGVAIGATYSGSIVAPTNGLIVEGNVGIGTSTPQSKLEVWENITATDGTAGAWMRLKNGAFGTGAVSTGIVFSTYNPDGTDKAGIFFRRNQGFGIGDLLFSINNTFDVSTVNASNTYVRMILSSDGNLGVGDITPTERLSVIGNILASGLDGDFYASTSNGVINCGGGIMSATINTIADATPTYNVVNGDEDLYIQDDLEVASQAYKPGGGSWATISDIRMKQNVQPFNDGLSKIIQINPVSYQYNAESGLNTSETYIGLVAQDAQSIMPYSVSPIYQGQIVEEDKNGNETIINQGREILSFDPSSLDYIMINAIKELKAENDELKARIQALENE